MNQDLSRYANPEEFKKVVHARRSVRSYTKDPVPESIVRECLDLALLAPNSSNLQSWEFYWVRTPELKSKMVQLCLSQPAAATAAEIIIAVARTKTWKKNAQQMLKIFAQNPAGVPPSAVTYYKKLVPFVYAVGPLGIFGFFKKIIFTIIGLFRPVPREMSSCADLKIWAVKSAALACENLMLAFRSFGFDTCPMEGLDSVKVKSALKLPCDAVIVMGIAVGKRDEKGVYGPRIRFNKEQFIKEV